MIRNCQLLTTLVATVCFAIGAAAADTGQPPRRARYPDASQTASPSPRYSIAGYGGFRLLQIDSALFESNEIDFGITDDDFSGGRVGFEMSFAVVPAVEILVGIGGGDAETYGNYLDFVYEDGAEIEHAAWVEMSEYVLGARIRPMPGSRLSPYLVFGLAAASYRYGEAGEFVDFDTGDIYYDEYRESLFLPGIFAGAGLDFALVRMQFGRRLEAFTEFRYARAQGAHKDGFDGFGDLTIGRTGALFGLRYRF